MKNKKIAALAAASVLTVSAAPTAWALEEPVVKDITTYTTVFGDANCDDAVNGNDVLTLIKYFLYRTAELPPEMSLSFDNSDVNRNALIELTDLATIKQYTVGDKVSMGGKAFSADGEKSENNPLVNVKQKFFIPFDSELQNFRPCVLTNYKDIEEELECFEKEEYLSWFDKVNIPGSPCYDGTKSYDIALFIPLENTSLNSENNVYIYDKKSATLTERNGDLRGGKYGLEILDEPGEFNTLAVYIINLQTTYKLSQQFENISFDNYITLYRNGNILSCGVFEDKPVIYLYPEEETDVHVELDFNGKLMHTYPKYSENGWDVTAQPDGTLTDKDGYEYSYLFWEGIGKSNWDMSEGFVIKGGDTVSFLREKLSYMGLTPKEYNEFIVYWLPKMENNKYNLITFQQEDYTENAKLSITPEPDSMQRVFMTFKALDDYIDVPEQELPTFERKGFSVVEWGGAEIKLQTMQTYL